MSDNKIPEAIRKKIRRITIHTRKKLSGTLVGDTRSAQKGTGFEFDQIREYVSGDDVRTIDWRATARCNSLLVKQYIEERSRTVFLVVDVSASSFYGSTTDTKYDFIAQVASIFTLVANYGNDLVGLILFSDIIEKYIPPRRGNAHINFVMQELFSFQPKRKSTACRVAFERLLQIKRKDTVVFMISDFIDDKLDTYLQSAARMYDLIAVRHLDKKERQFDNVGFLTVQDIESGSCVMVDTRSGISQFFRDRIVSQNALFKRHGVSVLELSEKNIVGDIVMFFRHRMRY